MTAAPSTGNQRQIRVRQLAGALFVALAFAILQLALATSAAAETGIPCLRTGFETVATDRPNYQGGETAHVTGTGYAPGCDVVIRITRPDAVVETATVTTDPLSGTLTYDYVLPGPPNITGDFLLEALGLDDAVLASTTFSDALTILADITPSYVAGANTVTFRTLVRNTSNDTTISQVNVDLPTGYTGASVAGTAFSSGTWAATTPATGFDFAFALTSGTPLATGTGWARIDITATTPAASATDWRFRACANVGCGGNNATRDDDNQAMVLVNATAPSDRYTADFRDGSSNVTTPSLRNGSPATLNLRITSSAGSNNSTKYTAIALPICWGSPSGVIQTQTAGSSYNPPLIRDGFIILANGSLGPVGNFMTVQFTVTPTACADGSVDVIPSVTSNQTDDAAGQNQVVGISGSFPSATMDSTPPEVTINQAGTQADPTTSSPIHFTAVFNEPVTGFASSDVSISGTAGATTVAVSEIAPNDGTTYDVAVSGMAQRGTVIATIPAGANSPSTSGAQDAAGNGNNASSSTDNSVTWDRVPATTTPSFSPASPKTNDLLSASTTTSDPDGDNVSVAWTWKVNRGGNICTIASDSSPSAGAGLRSVSLDLSQNYVPTSCTGAMINPLNPSKGDVVIVEATPNDGLFDGAMQSNSVSIVNSAPSLTAPAFNLSAPKTNDNLTATTTTSDVDGDNVSVAWVWKVNRGGDICTVQSDSSPLAAPGLRGPVSLDLSQNYVPTSCTGAMINPLNPSKGDIVVLEATPTDDDSTPASGTTEASSVTIANTPPVVALSAANDTTVNEGSTHTYSYSISDADGDTIASVSTSCGANGTESNASNTDTSGSFDCTFPDGPESSTVSAQATDSGFGAAAGNTATQSVTINNVAPSITISGAANVNEGSVYSLTLGAVSDPGSDTVTSYVVHWGDGNSNTYSTAGAKTHTYADGPNDYDVTVDLVDEDGTFTDRANDFSVHVNNVAPTVTFTSAPDTAYEGETKTYIYTVTDPGDDTFTVDATYPKCGLHGTIVGTPTVSASGGSFQCNFPDGPNSSTVAIKVTDSDGASDTDSEAVQIVAIANVPPSVTAPADQSSNEGAPHSFSLGSFTDPGSDADWTVTVDWDDGSLDTVFTTSSTGTIAAQSHTYADGPNDYTVSVTVTDKDGASDTKSFSVHVNNVAPTVTFTTAPATADEGDTKAYIYSISDPGVDTVNSVATSCGDFGTKTNATNTNTSGSFDCTFPDGPNSSTVSAQATDSDGDAGNTATQAVSIANVAPSTPNLVSPADNATTNDATPTFDWSDSTDPAGANDTITYTIQVDNSGCSFASPEINQSGLSSSDFTPAADLADGTYCWRVRATDSDGDNSAFSATWTLTIDTNDPPIANAGADVSGNEGSAIALNGSGSDPDNDPITFKWTYAPVSGVDAGASCSFAPNDTAEDPTITCTDDGTYRATLTVEDSKGATASDDATVTVSNANPVVTAVNETPPPYAMATTVVVSANFTDAGTNDTHRTPPGGNCTISWDDGTPSSTGVVTEANGSGNCSASHVYSGPGVYSVTITVTDDDGGSGSATVQVVVYDPSAGFVTGGGWINVAPGSYPADPALSGRANFGFTSKYKKGASIPTGETEFNFQVADFRFHSSTYQWLVVSGYKAQYKGTGEVNGVSGYDFRLTAYDGGVGGPGNTGQDRFRIKITEHSTGVVVFDNRLGSSDDMDVANPQAISGGSIVIHKA